MNSTIKEPVIYINNKPYYVGDSVRLYIFPSTDVDAYVRITNIEDTGMVSIANLNMPYQGTISTFLFCRHLQFICNPNTVYAKLVAKMEKLQKTLELTKKRYKEYENDLNSSTGSTNIFNDDLIAIKAKIDILAFALKTVRVDGEEVFPEGIKYNW